MNRNQAKEALSKGERLTHPYMKDGSIIMIKDVIWFDDGYKEKEEVFWSIRKTESYNKDWEIKTKNTSNE